MRCCRFFELAGPRTHSEKRGDGEGQSRRRKEASGERRRRRLKNVGWMDGGTDDEWRESQRGNKNPQLLIQITSIIL